MQNPAHFVSLEEVLNWYFSSNSHTQELSGKKLALTETYKQGNIVICDLKIKMKGYEEEEIFLENPFIRLNIRRGNSVMLVLKPDFCLEAQQTPSESLLSKIDMSHIINAEWVRRGLVKFFDISMSLLKKQIIPQEKCQNDKVTSQLSHSLIFNPVIEAMNSGKTVKIYQTEKANGENVQVSYIQSIKKWIISSKNCSIIVSSIEEIDNYQGLRNNFAKFIAKTWFRKLENMNHTEKLKDWLNCRTIVGEYIGNKEFEHIVKYSEETIKFYAVVENNSGLSCLPVTEAFFWFRYFGIETVNIKKIGNFNKPHQMFEELFRVFQEISVEDIESGGEGSVLYFVQCNANDNFSNLEDGIFLGNQLPEAETVIEHICRSQATIALGKIKTLEYRLFRKIREKLKKLTLEQNSLEKLKNSFESECQQLCQGFNMLDKLPFFLQQFEKIGKVRLEVLKNPEYSRIKQSENLNSFINTKYPPVFLETSWLIKLNIDNLKKLLPLNYTSSTYTKEYLNQNLYHNCLSPENLNGINDGLLYVVGYGEDDEEMFIEKSAQFSGPDDFPQELLKFNRKQDLGKMQGFIREEFQKMRKLFKDFGFPQTVRVKFYSSGEVDTVLKDIKQDLGIFEKVVSKVVVKKRQSGVILLPIMIPGSGKSFIRKYLFPMFNEKRKSIKFEFVECDNKRASIINEIEKSQPDCPFQSKFKQSSDKLKVWVRDLIKEKLDKSNIPVVFYLDRNFSDNSISDLQNSLKSVEHNITAIGLSPYDYSLEYLATCIKRVIQRENHPLYNYGNNSPLYKIKIVLEIFKKLNKKSINALKEYLNSIIKLPMFNQTEQYLQDYQKNTLKSSLENPENEENLNNVLEMLQDYNLHESNLGPEITVRLQEELARQGLLL